MSVSAGLPTGPSVPGWVPPQTITDRLNDIAVSVETYGATAAASALGNTAAFRAAVLALIARGGGRLLLPLRAYSVDLTDGQDLIFHDGPEPIQPVSMVGTTGGGTGSGTVVTRSAGTGRLLALVGTSPTDSTLRAAGGSDGIEWNGGGGSATIVQLERCNELKGNLRVRNGTGIGVLFRQVYNSQFDTVEIYNCGNGSATPGVVLDGFTGQTGTDTLQIAQLITEGMTGTDLQISGGSSSANPSQKIQIGNWKAESNLNRSWPVLDLVNASGVQFGNWHALLLHTSNTSKFIQGGTNGSDVIQFGNVVLNSAGAPTEYAILSGASQRWEFSNLYCTQTSPGTGPSNKYIQIASTVGVTAVALGNYIPASQAKAMDDLRTGASAMQRDVINLVPANQSAGATNASYNNHGVKVLAAAGFSIMEGEFQMPWDIASLLPFTVRMLWSSPVNAGNVRLVCELKAYGVGTLATATFNTNPQTVAVDATADKIKSTAWVSNSGFSPGSVLPGPGDRVAWRLYRDGDNAAESGAAATNIIHVYDMTAVPDRQIS